MIGQGADSLRTIPERIVGFASPQIREGEAAAELDSFDGRDGKKRMGKDSLEGVKPGLAHTGRQAGDRGFKNAADAVTLCSGSFNSELHFLPLRFIQDCEGEAVQPGKIDGEIAERRVADAGTAGDMGADQDAFPFQGGDHDGAGGNQCRGHSAAEMPAAAVILKAVIFHIRGIVRIPGAESAPGIIPAPRIRVGDQNGKRRAGGFAFKNAADDPERVRFTPRGTDLSRGAAFVKFLP